MGYWEVSRDVGTIPGSIFRGGSVTFIMVRSGKVIIIIIINKWVKA